MYKCLCLNKLLLNGSSSHAFGWMPEWTLETGSCLLLDQILVQLVQHHQYISTSRFSCKGFSRPYLKMPEIKPEMWCIQSIMGCDPFSMLSTVCTPVVFLLRLFKNVLRCSENWVDHPERNLVRSCSCLHLVKGPRSTFQPHEFSYRMLLESHGKDCNHRLGWWW